MSDKVNTWIKDATERVLSTAAEVAAAVAACYVFLQGTGLLELDYETLLAAGPMVVVAAVIKTIAVSQLGDKGSASFDFDPAKGVELDDHSDHDSV